MSATPLALVRRYLPKFTTLMNDIPADPDHADSGTQLVKTFATVITTSIQAKNPQQIVDEHDTNRAFTIEHGKEPSHKTINKAWWESKEPEKPQFIVRALFPIGPASKMTPPYFTRINQGILCQPHAENNNFRPIEFIADHVNKIFCRATHAGEPMNAKEVMEGFVEIFTSTTPVGNLDIDGLSFVFVKGKDLKPVRANRLDLVHALRVLFYTGYMVFFANPTAFKFFHPLFLITNVFLAQANFFPSNSDMNQPLSDAEKNNYLLALGLNIYEAMRKTLDAEVFLNAADLFPATVNPTTMPMPLGLGYDRLDIFTPLYFLFGHNVLEDTTEDAIVAEFFDHSILDFFNDAKSDKFEQMTAGNLKTLLTICCPKTVLNLRAKKNYGLKDKTAMVNSLKQHITTFGTNHAAYLTDLEATRTD
jgi:hypothetical protein